MKLLLLTTLVAACSAASFQMPQADKMDLVSITVTDTSGKAIYPVSPKKKFVVTVTAKYTGGSADKLKLNVKLAHWGDMKGSCGWDAQIVPFLNKLDGCAATKCPINAGTVVFKLPLDLTPIAGIIDAFGHNQVFQISVYVMDSSNKNQLGLGIAQVLVNDP